MSYSAKVEKAIEEELYVKNAYGYPHQKEGAALADQQVQYLQNEYGLKTHHQDADGDFKVHPMCVNCQARHILKYRQPGKTGQRPFQVKCNFVRGELPKHVSSVYRELLANDNLDPQVAKLVVQAPYDAASWAELMFGFRDDNDKWKLRWYQKEQVRCTSYRLAKRQGRRSGKSFAMAVKLLHKIFNTKIIASYSSKGVPSYRGPSIVIVTPFQTQLTVLFDEMQNLLNRNPELAGQVAKAKGNGLYTRQPNYKMAFQKPGEDFIAGGLIMGYVSGSNIKADGSGGGSLRGVSPDIIYLDEMDMIPEDILSSVIRPLLATSGDVEMFVSSTPIGVGRKGYFYKYCREDPHWTEYYLPTTVLPHWEQVREEIVAEGTNNEAFKAEYMAEFVESGQGVFKLEYILRAQKSYTYDDSRKENVRWWREVAGVTERNRLMTIIGIDWNKIAGTEMVVIAYDPAQHMWFVCDAVNILSSEFSTVRFKEALVDLNYKWKPDYVYPDEGFGHHVIEDLRYEALRLANQDVKTPVEAATVRLYDIMKPVNFSSKLIIRDPVSGEEKTKYAKELLVQNAVNVLEEGRIWMPETDRVLFNQMSKYVIERISAAGRPVYAPLDHKLGDHRLDAFMLALLGFFMEMHPLYAKHRYGGSDPAFLTKEELDLRGIPNTEGFGALVKTLRRMNLGVDLQKINFARPEPEQDEVLLSRHKAMSPKVERGRRPLTESEPESSGSVLLPPALETSGYVVNGERIPLIAPPTRVEKRGFRRSSSTSRSRSDRF
jgi:hypothetical protein